MSSSDNHFERYPAEMQQRFWAKVLKTDGCWWWQACKGATGYGHFSIGRRMHRAHRVSYEFTYGPIPAGLLICHTCDNPSCVNPSHLYAGTVKDNTQDMISRGRSTLRPRSVKTHCKNGHELSGENLVKGHNNRVCRICHNELARKRWAATYIPVERRPDTLCKHGHELIGDNLIILKNTGKRQCRLCQNEQARRRYEAKRKNLNSS